MSRAIPYLDVADLPEDTRIRMIGEKAMREKQRVGFLTDDEPGKADRYIAKLQKWFPGIVIVSQTSGPVAHVVTVIVEAPKD